MYWRIRHPLLPDAGTQATPADLTAYEQLLKNLEKGINDGKYTKAIADVLQAIFIDDTIRPASKTI
ncbi:hypothetical protein AAHB63_16920 [Bacillus thuringiensis]